MPYSRSHACLSCDLLCAHIAALRSKKNVSIPPCGKCSVNLSRLRYRLLTAWHFCFPGLFTNAKYGCWQYMSRKIPGTKENMDLTISAKRDVKKLNRVFHIPLFSCHILRQIMHIFINSYNNGYFSVNFFTIAAASGTFSSPPLITSAIASAI